MRRPLSVPYDLPFVVIVLCVALVEGKREILFRLHERRKFDQQLLSVLAVAYIPCSVDPCKSGSVQGSSGK